MVSPGVDPKILTQIVEFDRQVHRIEDAMAAGRRKVKSLEDTEAETKAELAEAQQRHREAKLEIRKLELEVEDLRRQVKTHNHRLSEISDTREYRALNDEVRYLTRQIGDKEEAQLALMESLEGLEKVVAERTEELQGKHGQTSEQKEKVDGESVGQQDELDQLKQQRATFMETLPANVVRFYERRAARCDLPVVWADGDACGYCHHKLTPQATIEVRYAKSLIECESCGRIVVAPADNGSGSATVQEAQ